MQSLRTRRPSTKQPAGRPQQRQKKITKDARKSRVDDKIKKRMSMRYADISAPTDLNIPAVPGLPNSTSIRPAAIEQDEIVYDKPSAKEDPWSADKKLLQAEDFDPEAYLRTKLANSTESEIRTLQSALRASQGETASDLQRNVFKNYAEFVLISKEISTLENEMLELKESLAEWKGMPSVLHIDESTSVAERKRNARSSVADLRILYANQMQTLHAQIEGSTKFAPTTPGRHVIMEMDGIFALNVATYKVDHSVRFVVLDDAVLVARKRQRRNNEMGKLVAERCWMLSEMLVLDTKDTPSMTNVFKVRHGKETHVYRTDSAANKKSLLSQFRLVAEELAAKKRKEREGEHERRKSLWAGGDRVSVMEKVPPMPDWIADLNQRAGGDTTGAKEKAERDARWVGEWADDLTVAIALKEWDQAVELVEQGKAKLSTTPPLTTKLPMLTASLTSSLLTSLALPTNRKSNVVHLISLLVRLQAGAAARSTFLTARTEVMKKHVRAIRFEGHIGMYVGDLSMVIFTGIKHTADWFLASFKENEVASCFIDWAQKQIESYAEMFRKQVYSSDVDPKTVEEALRITYSQSKKLLQEYGLDFRFLLDEQLVEKPKNKPIPAFSFHAKPVTRPEATSISIPPPVISPVSPPVISPAVRTPTVNIRTPISSRSRTSVPVPAQMPPPANDIPFPPGPSPVSTRSRPARQVPPPLGSATPRRTQAGTPMAEALPSPTSAFTATFDASGRPERPRPRVNNPSLPARSSNRPGSAAAPRPPPVAVPKREGMF